MALPRYAAIDSDTLEELKRQFRFSDSKGRIRLLRRLYKEAKPPYEVILQALEVPRNGDSGRVLADDTGRSAFRKVEDRSVEVRQWIARHGKDLNYQERAVRDAREANEDGGRDPESEPDEPQDRSDPSLNLVQRLKSDPDPFVRACLRENPQVVGEVDFIMLLEVADRGVEPRRGWWTESNHVERLALVRNPNVSLAFELIERIFDPDDERLGIKLRERKELILAFLTNEKAVEKSHQLHSWFEDGYMDYRVNELFSRLWKFASKWPPDSHVPAYVFSNLGAPDKAKAEVYCTCEDDG